ncbi:MAG: cytochrome c oxidase subunit II [Janthinobacterium lividum]
MSLSYTADGRAHARRRNAAQDVRRHRVLSIIASARRRAALGPAAALLALSSAARAAPGQDALRPAGIQAAHILDLWRLTLVVCAAVFAAVLGALLIGMMRAAQRDKRSAPSQPSAGQEAGPRRAVTVATAVSIVLLIGLVLADVMTDRALSSLPVAHALHIEMIGHQWWWETRYADDDGQPGFVVANELHVPVGRPVIVSLRSADVIHTFWVPNLHGKKDMIPGRDATIEFRADKAGDYRGQCAEFCGAEHALMAFSVVAESPQQYRAWSRQQRQLAATPTDGAAVRGQQLFLSNACAQCHTVRGTPGRGAVGPDLTHVASRPTLAAGTLANTQANLFAWINDPQRMKPATTMPASKLAPADLQLLVAYLETLK